MNKDSDKINRNLVDGAYKTPSGRMYPVEDMWDYRMYLVSELFKVKLNKGVNADPPFRFVKPDGNYSRAIPSYQDAENRLRQYQAKVLMDVFIGKFDSCFPGGK